MCSIAFGDERELSEEVIEDEPACIVDVAWRRTLGHLGNLETARRREEGARLGVVPGRARNLSARAQHGSCDDALERRQRELGQGEDVGHHGGGRRDGHDPVACHLAPVGHARQHAAQRRRVHGVEERSPTVVPAHARDHRPLGE